MDKLSDFLTIIIAFGMFYIAYQQWNTSEKEIRKQLFEKRYKNIYSPIRIAMTTFLCFVVGIMPYNETEENFIQPLIRNINESFANNKHLLPKQIVKVLSKHIKKLCDELQNYTIAKTPKEDLKSARLVIQEYLIILHFISQYLFIENSKPLNLYQFITEVLTNMGKFLLPFNIQEKFLETYFEKESIKITTFGSQEQKEFAQDLLSHGKSFI